MVSNDFRFIAEQWRGWLIKGDYEVFCLEGTHDERSVGDLQDDTPATDLHPIAELFFFKKI
jgi:hypothetical protein